MLPENRLHELEIVEAIQLTSKIYGVQLDYALQLVTQALLYSTPHSPDTTKEKLRDFFLYPTTVQNFQNTDLHIAYYLTAGVGIDRVRKYTKASQPRVYKVKNEEAFIPIYGPNLIDVLQLPDVLPNLKYLTKSLNTLNGQMLPDSYYQSQPQPEPEQPSEAGRSILDEYFGV